jgi:hypothetical protein
LVETFNAEILDVYAVHAVGCALAPILVRVKYPQQSAATSVLQTMSSTQPGDFALAYADQAERDHAVLKAAVRKGKIAVCQESMPS